MIREVALSAVMMSLVAGSALAVDRPVWSSSFESQGCSSCPPAKANLIRLASRPGLLPLSFSVTCWDRLGWKDTFGRPEFTERQAVRARAWRERCVHPQIVVNGRLSAVGSRRGDVDGPTSGWCATIRGSRPSRSAAEKTPAGRCRMRTSSWSCAGSGTGTASLERCRSQAESPR